MACGALSQDLSLQCGSNTGGVYSMYVTEYANLKQSGFTYNASGSTVTAIALNTGTKFYLIPQRRGANTFSFEEKSQFNPANGSLFYDQVASFVFPKMSASNQGIFTQMLQNDLMVIVKDNNSNYWLLGSDKGLTCKQADATTGKAYADLNGYTVSIGDGGETYRALALTAAQVASLVTPAP